MKIYNEKKVKIKNETKMKIQNEMKIVEFKMKWKFKMK